jgi:uncharacterized protein
MNVIRNIVAHIFFSGLLVAASGFSTAGYAQDSLARKADPIQVIARVSADSITLRWAPLTKDHWFSANQYGYTVQRFTLVRNGKVVAKPEQKLLASALKPLPEDQWAGLTQNKYAMVAAQALYGESFELNIEQSDVMQIVNKARENEQRYSIALFCADMSPAVAKAEGLYWNDTKVEKNVKYLYRVQVYLPGDTLTGSVFVDTSQKQDLRAVKDLQAEALGNAISLRWNQVDLASQYTTYLVERSADGQNFAVVSDIAGVTLSKKGQDTKYQYAVDTVPSLTQAYRYRVRGLTPFGEQGPVSNVVSVKGNKVTTSSVFITSALSSDNKSIDIQWEFPAADNDAITGFEVTRSPKSSGPYKTVHTAPLLPAARAFKDVTPQQTNYYQVKARTQGGGEIVSMPYLALLVDSIPPVLPTGLKGVVDEFGKVSLSWKPNPDADILGYRVYRAYYQREEFALQTGDVLRDTVYTDRVELKGLNDKIHYRLMAIDKNQNHSGLSVILSLALPDKVPPMPPVWLPVQSTKEGARLSWMPSGSLDVVRYEVFRKGDQGQWMRMASIPAGTDTVYSFVDKSPTNNKNQYYTVVAVDDAGLESPPTAPMTGFKLPQLKPEVVVNQPAVDREQKRIKLTWNYTEQGVASYRIYRTYNDGSTLLYRTVKEKQFTDNEVVPGGNYSYQVMAIFQDQAKSAMSKKISVDF